MTFLAPTSAILAAAIGLSLLIALSLLRLRRRPVWVASTLFWESSARDLEVNVPLRMLRASWLLLLHALAIGLLAAAIGRPISQGGEESATRVVFLIDRSASMGAMDHVESSGGRTTRLRGAVELARRSIRDLGRGDRSAAAIVVFGAGPAMLSEFTTDRRLLERALDQITPTHEDDHGLGAAMELVRAMIADDGDESAPPARVVVISDGAPAPVEGAAVPGAVIEFQRVGPDPGILADNVGIVALAARRSADMPSRIRVFARVLSSADVRRDVIVTFRAGDDVVVSRAVTIEPRAGAQPEASVVADIDIASDALITVRIERADVLEADNEASIWVRASRPLRIMLVTPSGDPDADGAWPLLDVLTELPRATTRVVSAVAWNALAGTRDDAELFADLVVLSGVEPGWARARAIGVPVLAFGVLPPDPLVQLEREGPTGSRIIAWDREHLLTRHVAFDTVLASQMPRYEYSSGARVDPIVWSDAGIAVSASEAGAGRWVAVSFPVASSNWPLQPSWPLFVENAVDWLTRRTERESGRVWSAGEPISLSVPSRGATYVFRPPGASEGRRVSSDRSGDVSIPAQPLAGVYQLASEQDGESHPVPVAVLKGDETLCRTSDRLSIGSQPVEASSASETRRELWPWFVGALLVVLTLEWMVFASRSRIS
ncbi:MAG: VWA domain-containing protein [Phycisphaeraceae bacterium]|nr:VWA domain-containing protein [Phycisphaeraceae bacterium]